MGEFFEFAKQFGAWAALCGVFIWQTIIRENRLSKRIGEVEDFTRGELTELVKDATSATDRNSAALDRNTAVLDRVDRKV